MIENRFQNVACDGQKYQDGVEDLISVQSTCRTRSSSAVILARPSVFSLQYKSPTAVLDMRHLTCGISCRLYSANLILFTLLLVHVILHISPHQSHHICSQMRRTHSPGGANTTAEFFVGVIIRVSIRNKKPSCR